MRSGRVPSPAPGPLPQPFWPRSDDAQPPRDRDVPRRCRAVAAGSLPGRLVDLRHRVGRGGEHRGRDGKRPHADRLGAHRVAELAHRGAGHRDRCHRLRPAALRRHRRQPAPDHLRDVLERRHRSELHPHGRAGRLVALHGHPGVRPVAWPGEPRRHRSDGGGAGAGPVRRDRRTPRHERQRDAVGLRHRRVRDLPARHDDRSDAERDAGRRLHARRRTGWRERRRSRVGARRHCGRAAPGAGRGCAQRRVGRLLARGRRHRACGAGLHQHPGVAER